MWEKHIGKITNKFPTLLQRWRSYVEYLFRNNKKRSIMTAKDAQTITDRINYLTSLPELTQEQETELFDLYNESEVETY